jgi:hypothetical protein
VSILPGNGDGTFGSARYSVLSNGWTASHYPVSLAAGDFNGDGTIDLAVADFEASTIDVLLNSPAGKHNR